MQNQFTDADKMLETHRLIKFDFSLSFDCISVIVPKCYPESECARLSTLFQQNNTLNLFYYCSGAKPGTIDLLSMNIHCTNENRKYSLNTVLFN